MTRAGFELQTSRIVAYVLYHYATEAAGMMGQAAYIKPGKHMIVNSHSVFGRRVHKLGSHIHGGRVCMHYEIRINYCSLNLHNQHEFKFKTY